jgi:hypothetical protein
MADISTLVNSMLTDGSVTTIARNRRAAFGRATRRYLGTTLLPERNVDENAYRDYSIKYRTVIANDGARYSPVQLKGGGLAGSMLVVLTEQLNQGVVHLRGEFRPNIAVAQLNEHRTGQAASL